MDALAESRSWDKLEEKAAVTHPSTSRHGHPQKTSSALIRFDPLKMQYCAVGVLESHNDYNEIHRRLTSRHVLDMFGSHASLSDSHPSSFLLPSIPPLHLGHRTFLNRCRPLLHDDLHGDIWAQLGTCPDIARITNNPPELLRKIQVSNPTHGLLRPFTKQRFNDRKQDQLAAKPFPQMRPSLHAVSR